MIKIRCSMLSSYQDCPRRSAAKQWRSMISDAGYTLRELPPKIGASVGTGYHAAAKLAMQTKKETGTAAPENDAIESGVVEFRNITRDGVVWDATTNNSNIAEKQLQILVRAFYNESEPKIQPVNVEIFRKAESKGGFLLTGSSDSESTDTMDDWKSGVKSRSCSAQLGGYLILRLSNGGNPVNVLRQHYNPRVSLKKPHPGITVYDYDPKQGVSEAFAAINRIKYDVEQFIKTGSPQSFPANPMSMLCSDKWCPAWGTGWCGLGV